MTHEEQEVIMEIEEDVRELRLTEQAFFKNLIHNIKRHYKRVVFWLATVALVWGFWACTLLHSVGLCPLMR